jgi:hypothetical protein
MSLRQLRGVLPKRSRRQLISWSFRPRLEQLESRLLPNIDFSNGFFSGGLTTNGSAQINTSVLQLTQGQTGQDGSAFSNFGQSIAKFSTGFSFQLTNPNADGFTFCMQAGAATALGPPGGGLGYGPDHAGRAGGIAKSVAVKFDLFDNEGEGADSTGLYINGAAPTNVGSVNLGASGIDLHSGDVFKVVMTYDGVTLKVMLTDANTGASNTQNYSVDIPTAVGGMLAFVGFTGATGSLTATENILNWTYIVGAAVPPAPPGGVMAGVGFGNIGLSWTASSGASSYNVYRSTSSGAETIYKSGVTGTNFIDPNVLGGTTYFYKVTAVGIGGESLLAASTEVSATAGPWLDFSRGFGGAGGVLTTNGSAMITGDPYLQLTNGQTDQAGSAFADVKQDITSFANNFSFQLVNPNADGFTFCIQDGAATALGPDGGGLGYGPGHTGGTGGIANSVAVKFDLYDNQGEGADSTGIYINGAAPTNVGSVDLGPSGIDLHSGHIFNVGMNYFSHVLTVVLTDTNTGMSNTQAYPIDIATTLGASTAYVGFTGATGSLTATQNILNWRFGPNV